MARFNILHPDMNSNAFRMASRVKVTVRANARCSACGRLQCHDGAKTIGCTNPSISSMSHFWITP
eukprot:4964882-Amphidinium_carterae.1